ncbi:hypothetical protein [Kaistella soli]|uniref:hypothetical protein n=1 Tax=Kaistella soli TaxID=2849654 RepID=UPI001C25A924|nr:hypothetical protein [Kaistella soli]
MNPQYAEIDAPPEEMVPQPEEMAPQRTEVTKQYCGTISVADNSNIPCIFKKFDIKN